MTNRWQSRNNTSRFILRRAGGTSSGDAQHALVAVLPARSLILRIARFAAVWTASLWITSCGGSGGNTSETNPPQAATPTFSPSGGTYTSPQTVTIGDATAGAIIYYTTNGTTPTTGSSKYTGAITVSSSETIEAIAASSGYTDSAVGSVAYTITISGASYEVDLTWSAPVVSPDPVAGYDIFRASGGSSTYALIGSVDSSELKYTDTNELQNGETYDYIVESVDASGNESVPSNVASVFIPQS